MMLNAMPVKKGARNEFAKYNYMELGDFLIPTQQIFTQLGLCGVVSFKPDLATLTIHDLESDQKVEITSPMSTAALKGCHEVQNLGAVQTYLRRYLWVAAMEIVEHDAIDSSEPVKEPTVEQIQLAIEALTLASKRGVDAFKAAVELIPAPVKEKIDANIKKSLFAQAKKSDVKEEVKEEVPA
jgi:hypothetical protein